MQSPATSLLGNMDRTNTLVIVCGAPGVGKSTVAQLAANEITADVLRNDEIRKELVDNPTYSTEETQRVYNELLNRAKRQLRAGKNIVLDATFSNRQFRVEARSLGREVAGSCRVLHVQCNEPVVENRIAERTGISDADFKIHKQIKGSFDPIVYPHSTIDNSGELPQTREQVALALF